MAHSDSETLHCVAHCHRLMISQVANKSQSNMGTIICLQYAHYRHMKHHGVGCHGSSTGCQTFNKFTSLQN